ncbi:hypothetical protein V1512DRAFT_238088 [Lipomyces arxii]|uniref:uncharacterized protein n=1 Tax=Lipomyces arxii TaxID=56418 RepID=UPI0034CD3B67
MGSRGRATFQIFAQSDGEEQLASIPEMDPELISRSSFINSFSWSTSPLGDKDKWSPTLLTYYQLVMVTPLAAVLAYGEDLTLIFNADFGDIVGLDFCTYFGRSFYEVWTGSEFSVELADAMATCMSTARPTTLENMLLFATTADDLLPLRETYVTWNLVPVAEPDGSVSGVLIAVRDTSEVVLHERRNEVLKELYDATASAEVLSVFFTESVSVLRKHSAEDIALFGLYICESQTSRVLQYRCGFGLQVNPESIAFDPNPALFEQAILDTASSGVYITASADGFRQYIEYDPARGWSDEVSELIFLPIMRDNNSVFGVAIIGLNPRRSFDEPYELFLELLSRQIATGVDNLRHIEEASNKLSWEVAMSLRQTEELQEQLMERTKQLKVSEGRFSRMATILPAGLFLASAEGEIIYANEAWFKLSSLPRDNNPTYWIKAVHMGDRSLVRDSWRRVMQGKDERIEFRWARRRGEASTVERWCDSAVSAEVDADTGNILYITGVWSDITERKQAEAMQKQRADDAVERRRQQEYFIDAISHELRNPLSAIIQSVDVVCEKVETVKSKLKEIEFEEGKQEAFEPEVQELDECLDCLQTVQLCTSHMRQIITDTINLSKVESGLFPIHPIDCRPVDVAREVLRMYENELRSLSITYSFELGENFKELGIDTVKMDPRRVSQVLINLVSNAMKVLATSEQRHIKIKLDAYPTKPTFQFQNHSSFYVHQPRSKSVYMSSSTSPPKRSASLSVSSGTSSSLTTLSALASIGATTAAVSDKSVPRATSYATLAASLSSSPSSLTLNTADAVKQQQEAENTVYLMYSVKDTGSGMDAEQLKTAFQKFTSHFTPRTHVNYGGAGLGLHICRKLVENQGGEITAESKTNEGSEFLFYIKAVRPEGQVSPSMSKKTPTTPSVPNFERAASKKVETKYLGKTILVVEDNIVNQKLLQRQLQSVGFKTIVANHGQEAVDVVMSGAAPDACVMDCEMPVMDGVRAVETIRELERTGVVCGRLPIIGLSANARQVHFERMSAAGSDRYLTKPFSFSNLIDVVNELLEKKENFFFEQEDGVAPDTMPSSSNASRRTSENEE